MLQFDECSVRTLIEADLPRKIRIESGTARLPSLANGREHGFLGIRRFHVVLSPEAALPEPGSERRGSTCPSKYRIHVGRCTPNPVLQFRRDDDGGATSFPAGGRQSSLDVSFHRGSIQRVILTRPVMIENHKGVRGLVDGKEQKLGAIGEATGIMRGMRMQLNGDSPDSQ